ncbi:MAG TPA: HIT family protein [Nitriliruptorales bacterium]|nr:HIT family protein [Nitriliruptorales bacterium]
MSPDACVFCRVVAGDTAAHVVVDEAAAVAFLDRRPLFPGHCLVVPRAHHETLTDLPPEDVGAFFQVVRRLCAAVPVAVDALGSFAAVNNRVSQSVPHLHVHVVPRRPKDGLRGFFWPRTQYESEQHAADVAAAIRAALR